MKEWTRSETLALAINSCTQCHGLGLLTGPLRRQGTPCNCVLRAVFRLCFNKFREVALTPARLHAGRKNEEYMADFCLIAKRTLTEEEHAIFRYHFMLGAQWSLCCRKLSIDKGSFFHAVYRIEQKLGRTFRDLEPYALFPLDDYFHGGLRNAGPEIVMPAKGAGSSLSSRVPVRQAA